MTGRRTDQPSVEVSKTLGSRTIATPSITQRPKANEDKTMRPSRAFPRKSQAKSATTKKTKRKVNSRKMGTGWAASIQPMSPSKTGIAANRGIKAGFPATSKPKPDLCIRRAPTHLLLWVGKHRNELSDVYLASGIVTLPKKR